uniref:Myb-like domain-containing protein n=1 Tax=Hordeum vulgare subsp. vulgare TaxID=112509 RepID=A0A8I6WLA1_HORVV
MGPQGWTLEKDKALDNVVVFVDLMEGEAIWTKIAKVVGGKTTKVVKRHYELLVEDVDAIDACECLFPMYSDSETTEERGSNEKNCGGKVVRGQGRYRQKGLSKSVEHEHRKGSSWRGIA